MGSWVMPGTPSAALWSAMPCQWMEVLSGSSLVISTWRTSPAVASMAASPGVRDVSPRLGFDAADIQGEGPGGQCPAHRRLTERSGGGSGAKGGTWCRGSGSRVAGAGGHGPGTGEDEPAEQKLSSGKRVRHDLTFLV
ncbi:hypothetical protein W5M_00105 [Corynebacterium diphtheriae bv. intermedius str. NCTC 5011]|nr:hypothetical protein W5M_00105 [Corynebacterium diphtheriae bv. intermedius str. NCTC 5011]